MTWTVEIARQTVKQVLKLPTRAKDALMNLSETWS